MLHDASLNIRQLQVFEAVARLESYSRAQQELGISVSAISNAMSQLEGQLGFTLCQRGRGGFSLTEKGQQFLQQAIRVLSELNELERSRRCSKGSTAAPCASRRSTPSRPKRRSRCRWFCAASATNFPMCISN